MLKIENTPVNDFVFQHTFCSLPYTKMILNSWGEVSMCCHQLTQLGKIEEDTNILDLWNSPLAKEIRETTTQGNLHKVCSSWNSCPYMVMEKKFGDVLTHKDSKYPTYLEICLPDQHCNVGGLKPTDKNPACIMCRRNFNTPEQKDLTDLLCRKARVLMPYLRELCVLGIAEPFWKDAVFNIFELLEFEKYKNQIKFVTNTNGICLTEKVANKFFEKTNYSELSWSLDSATAITHEKIRRLDTFDLVVKNLRRWIELKRQFGQHHHQVVIYNNINLLNVHEMTMMVEMAAELQVDKMIMLPTYDQAGVVQLGELLLCQKNVHIFKKCSEMARERANQLNVNLHYSKSFELVPPPVSNGLTIIT